ncbi:XDD3 family exosortase-dependent surface protein [Coleofasciculus sp. FACHB-SPT9]|uniref:XDD3 family exosortase-dependent surface protein n=1 Tax=Cyanophyceae TaxID=3028117 RepID=UPI001682D86A|nr:XDD3 family exosortase-dependent surface protein [Coleofasciculus sp. FACHB-SPT9]MBD1890029.1 PEP-CTERM sorting domain-containing protein [Coleofasciculus sp. FACHB-SPT9]
MKLRNFATLMAGAAAALCLVSVTGQQANAGTIYKDWNYGIDAFNDGSGGSGYEIKGMAIKETSDSIFVALTGGTSLTGTYASGAADKNIGWGDLFFNFTDKTFKAASDAKSLFGIRFAATNDSMVSSTGVYQNVQAASVTATNDGYSSLKQYYNSGWDRENTQGTDLATKTDAYAYFGEGSILNVIGSGTKVGDITMLTASALSTAGLDFAKFSASGSQTIGFQFSKSLFEGGNYIANTFIECGNDGVVLKGNLKDVPEPSGIAGIAVVGLVLGSKLRKRR